MVALDGDTKNSTFSETFKKAFPERYIECFIAEQNMVHNVLVFTGNLNTVALFEVKVQKSDMINSTYERVIILVHATLFTTIICSIFV